jgi:NTP pyrophosphatase (non-canonical NTP hydrolase)
MNALRPVLARFAEEMESKLKANDHKGGWRNDSPWALLERLREEEEELATAIARCASPEEIRAEAANVANFAMMIADVFEALEEPGVAYIVTGDPPTTPSAKASPDVPVHEGTWGRGCHPHCQGCLQEALRKEAK